MYLSFGSTILQDNQVTDYLIRVVQPRLSAIAGVQRADILGGRTFAIRAWLKPDRMAALERQPVAGPPGARRQQLPRRRRADQGRARPAEPHRDDRPPLGRRVQEARHPRAERRARAPRGRRRRRARRGRRTTRTCASRARRPCSWASGCCPTPTRSTSSAASARRSSRSSASCRRACRRSIAFDSTDVHQGRDRRGRARRCSRRS